MANAQELYHEALRQLAAGQKEAAIRLLGESLQEDSSDVKTWLKLAEIMPDSDDKFDVLEQILQLDPGNAYANSEWDRLNALAESGTAASPAPQPQASDELSYGEDFSALLEDDKPASHVDTIYERLAQIRAQIVARVEVYEKKYLDPVMGRFQPGQDIVPGISRREAGRVVGALLVFTLFMCMCSNIVIGFANLQEAQVVAEQTQLALEVAGIALTADANRTEVALAQTSTSVAETATALVVYTPPPTATNTPFVTLPTEIPPSATPTEVVIAARILPPPPESAAGRLLAWGGINPASRQFLFLQSVTLPAGEITELNQDAVAFPTTDRRRSQIIYTQFDPRNNQTLLYRVDGVMPEQAGSLMSLVWETSGLREESRPALAASGNYLVFIARTPQETTQVFLYDFLNQRLRQITNDNFNYRAAAIAPGGAQVIAIKEAAGGVDLVLIDVLLDVAPEELPQTLLTTDGNLLIEDAPQFSPDGQRIVFHATSATSPNSADVILFDLATRTGTAIAANPADERYPYFSPDSRFIVYSSDITSTYNLYIYDTISQATFQVTESRLAPVFAAGWSE